MKSDGLLDDSHIRKGKVELKWNDARDRSGNKKDVLLAAFIENLELFAGLAVEVPNTNVMVTGTFCIIPG